MTGQAVADDGQVIAVVVNPANSVTSLAQYDIARIFRGEMTHWPEGKRIQVIDYTSTTHERAMFYQRIFDTGPKRLQPRGSPYIFRPIEQHSAALAKRLLAAMPNAIAYMSLADVDKHVKVVATIEVRR